MSADETRQSILAAAGALFLELGYDGTTTRNVARRAGVSPAALAHHFGRKHELYLAVTESIQWDVYSVIEEIVDGPGPVGDKVEAILRLDDRPSALDGGYLQFLSSVGVEAGRHPELAPALEQVPFDDLFDRLVREGVERGAFGAGDALGVVAALRVLLGGIGLQSWAEVQTRSSPIDACVDLVRGRLFPAS